MMEKQLKCVLLLSLKEMALRRVAATLWSGSDILASPLSTDGVAKIHDRVQYKATEVKIKDKILKLGLPESIIKQMNDIVRPIILEGRVRKYFQILRFVGLYNTIDLPDSVKFCWTTSGTINLRQTAEQFLRCDGLGVQRRYEIACHYCLEDSISLYWEELSEEEKGSYVENRESLSVWQTPPYWFSCILKDERPELDYWKRESGRNLTSFHQFAFEDSAKEGDKTVAEYFFQKLTPEEREASLMRTAHAVIADRYVGSFVTEKRSGLLCYLLSVMSPGQQMEIIKSYPINVFSCFLHWPLQDLFSDNAGLLWTFLPPSSYADLVKEIVYRCGCSDIYFAKIFKEFFMSSPQDFKKCFVDEEFYDSYSPGFSFLDLFFRHDDSESIKVLFRNLDAADRVKLVFQPRVFALFSIYMFNDRWHLVEVCLREATLSGEERGRLKDAFTRFLEREGMKKNVYSDFKRLFEFLGETDASSNKREKGQKRKLGDGGQPEYELVEL